MIRIEVEFGLLLRCLRKEKNLSQQELAYKADLDRTYISLIERGQRTPTIETLFKLSKALELDPSSLIKKLEFQIENCKKI